MAKKLKPIRLTPLPPVSLLGGDTIRKDARGKQLLEIAHEYTQQLDEVAESAGITVAELLDNKPLMRFAETVYGLGEVVTAKKVGRPEFWTAGRLLHLWIYVKASDKPNVLEALRTYRKRFETRCSTDQALNTVYHQQAVASPLVAFALELQKDSRVSHFVAEYMELECLHILPGWPEEDQK